MRSVFLFNCIVWEFTGLDNLAPGDCTMEAAWFYITAEYDEDEYEVPVKLPRP